MSYVYSPVLMSCLVCCVCVCVFLALRLPVPASLFLCHCVSSLIAGLSGRIDFEQQDNQVIKLFHWLSVPSLSIFCLLPVSFLISPSLSSLSVPLYSHSLPSISPQPPHPLCPFYFPFLLPLCSPLCCFSPPPSEQADRPVLQRSLIAAGLPANVFRCHGDATANGTVRTEQMRSSVLQVGLWWAVEMWDGKGQKIILNRICFELQLNTSLVSYYWVKSFEVICLYLPHSAALQS